MGRGTSYPPELRAEYPSDWPAIRAVAAKLGIGSAETLRRVRQSEVDGGKRPGVSSEECGELRAEVRELWANSLLFNLRERHCGETSGQRQQPKYDEEQR